jgi:protein-S-isoprenylcysteine O-methyltransferase Ste14
MADGLTFSLGLALMLVLVVVIGRRLGQEYRSFLHPSIQTVAAEWACSGVHFSLVVLAATRSTWHFSLPAPLALGGGLTLVAVGGAIYLTATYVFGFKRQLGLDTTRLVTEGIYRWSRNPLFVGWTLVLIGLGLARESAMVLFLTLVLWVCYRFCLPLEEELLSRLYGEAYETYRQHTHRYFGPPRSVAETPQNKDMRPADFGR